MNSQPGAEIYNRLCDSFNRQGLMQLFGATIELDEPGLVRISAPIQETTSQQHGYAHAGLTFALGDSAAGYAALSLMDVGREVLTAEIKINLLAPARGDRLEAVGRVLRPGRKLFTVESNVFVVDGDTRTHIAVLLGTMVSVATSD